MFNSLSNPANIRKLRKERIRERKLSVVKEHKNRYEYSLICLATHGCAELKIDKKRKKKQRI